MVITRVGPLSVAKIAGILYALIGLAIGAIFSLIGLAGMAGGLASESRDTALFGALFGVGAIIAFPIFYGVLGFVMMLLMAALFNLAARLAGGVEVDVQ
jgi:hypothetical protein